MAVNEVCTRIRGVCAHSAWPSPATTMAPDANSQARPYGRGSLNINTRHNRPNLSHLLRA